MTAAGGPGAGARRNWRKLNNALHRDVGYLIVGLTIVYGVSGLAVNHRADWNPSYRTAKRALQIAQERLLRRRFFLCLATGGDKQTECCRGKEDERPSSDRRSSGSC